MEADRNVDAVYFMLGAGQSHRLAFRKKPRNTQTITKPQSSLKIGLSFYFAAFPNNNNNNNNNLRPPGAYRAMSHGACCLLS